MFPTPTFNVQLEVTTRCNDNCLFCPRATIIKSGKRRLADAPLSLFSLIVEQLAEIQARKVVIISGLGEPLLYSQLAEVLRLLKRLGPNTHIGLNTNGILLDREHASLLLSSDLDSLRCSLNLATADLFKRFRRSGDFNKVRDNIIHFLKMKGSRKPRVQVRINDFDVNSPYMVFAKWFWSNHLNRNDVFEVGGFSNWAGKIERAAYLSRAPPPRKPCKYLWNHLTINLEGDVFPCCLGIAENRDSPLYLGTITEDITLLDLYAGPRLQHLRLQHKQKNYSIPCSLCDSYGPTNSSVMV